MMYRILVRSKQSGAFEVDIEGEAKSRRSFLKANKERVEVLRNGYAWKCIKVV